MKYKNLTIVGSSHISKKSIAEVKKAIKEVSPEIVALELDPPRFFALKSKKRSISPALIKQIGLNGYIFSLLGAWAEKKLGKITGVSPGEEMLTAANLAKKQKIKIAFIDQDIRITLKKLSKKLTWKEKFRFLWDLIKSAFGVKEKIPFDINNVPEEKIIQELLKKVKSRYPTIYQVLIKDRNKVLAKNLFHLMQNQKEIVAVMGAGHCSKVIEIIKDIEVYEFSRQINK